MVKPITVIREDLRKAITQAINEYGNGIPAFVTVDILQNLLAELREIERSQLEADIKRYQEELMKEQEDTE